MRILPDTDDAPEFIALVERICLGVLRHHAPESIVLIKIDNWFGSKWLGFSGKSLGAIGVWNKPYDRPATDIRIPPFVPHRVASQRRFAAPTYEEIDPGKPVHARMRSSVALWRKAALAASATALVWYSGKSSGSGRGAVMAYVPVKNSYWPWYAGWEKRQSWHLSETWDIKREQLTQLIDESSLSLG